MKRFAQSVLNYFAAFTETRFRFSRKLPYEWTDDAYSLDLSVFPAFQQLVIDAVAGNRPFTFEIEKGQFTVQLDHAAFLATLQKVVAEEFSPAFLEENTAQKLQLLQEAQPDEPEGELSRLAFVEGIREYNLAIRHRLLELLTEAQAQHVRILQDDYDFHRIPPSSFNAQRTVQVIHDDLKREAAKHYSAAPYCSAVLDYLGAQSYSYIIYDLHHVLRAFLHSIGVQSLYIFFHEIVKEEQGYPLYAVEINLLDNDNRLVVQAARDVVMLNTPGVNSFSLDKVLTTPRACRFADAATTLLAMEKFLQAQYTVPSSFILTPHFRPLVADDLPTIRYRVGIQAVKEEDRRILDYSELITSLETGSGRKFIELIGRYVGGNVQNTSDEVQEAYSKNYPHKSADRLVPHRLTVPLSLNDKQKRILTAIENGSNEIIVVDGPPGTGKSYTICAIVHLANQLGKSVVITSHKKQALDVIDEALTKQFKRLHPSSKPSILRLEKGRGATSGNNLDNTLSSPAINGARSRFQQCNHHAVAVDRDRLYKAIDQCNQQFWEVSGQYDTRIRNVFAWSNLLKELEELEPRIAEIDLARLPANAAIDFDRIRRVAALPQTAQSPMPLANLAVLFRQRDELPLVLERCEQLNRLGVTMSGAMLEDQAGDLPETDDFLQVIGELEPYLTAEATIGDVVTVTPESLPPPIFPWPEITTRDQLEQARAVMAQLGQLQTKFLGKLLNNKGRNLLKGRITALSATLGAALDNKDPSMVLAELEQVVDALTQYQVLHPWLNWEYILSGHTKTPIDRIASLAAQLIALRFAEVAEMVARRAGKDFTALPLREIQEQFKMRQSARAAQALWAGVRYFAEQVNQANAPLAKIFKAIREAADFVHEVTEQDIAALQSLFDHFGELLAVAGITPEETSTLARLNSPEHLAPKMLPFMELHTTLSRDQEAGPPTRSQYEEFFVKSQKLLEYQTDQRMSNLLNHASDSQRLQHAIHAGKRMSSEQARVLLQSLSCIIAEPDCIAQHLPMEADMIDLLIIDEASQVSIAESISLMLRAKQTVVLGDELQYGAVGALNISQNYSAYYFKDILRDYALDLNQPISEEEQEKIALEASVDLGEEEEQSSMPIAVSPGTKEWLKTFSVRTSTLAFAKALTNYSETLNVHFRSFPEIISYSNEFFYKEGQVELITNRIRTKPIAEVLCFLPVETKGFSGGNVNLDEIEAIKNDLIQRIDQGYKGSIGIICSFKEQAARMGEIFRKELSIHPDLVRKHGFKIWFVGDVQGEERDLIYYSFVQDKKLNNADLKAIYPTIGGTADNIRRLKMQRLNVGFSRAKDIMVFVHSMPLGDYNDSRLGDALLHYHQVLTTSHDHIVEDESVFDSPAEKELYATLLQTDFFQKHRDTIRLIAQFEIGKYIRQEFHRSIPNYRVDFLLTRTEGGKEKSLIIEYDGVEFHTKNPDAVTSHNFEQEYLEYDIERQLELEQYGYAFLRINKFTLVPDKGRTRVDVLNQLLEEAFAH